VVAYALAGTVDIDLYTEAIGLDRDGEPVFLHEIWPSTQEVREAVAQAVKPEMYQAKYADVYTGNQTWNAIQGGDSEIYGWTSDSTYIQEPPFFTEMTAEVPDIQPIKRARVLALLGDSVTTDHISPAGAIPADGPAGKYLQSQGVSVREFNTFGSRRGNHEVMMRGTFGNIRLRNLLVPGVEGSYTVHFPGREQMSIYDAAMKYQAEGVPLVVLAGKEYGTGSSRDWAAKGTNLLGVQVVIAETFERIHRANLVGMGVLPLEFKPGESAESLGLTGQEFFTIEGLGNDVEPQSEVTVKVEKESGEILSFQTDLRIDTQIEVEYYRNGGILHKVIRDMLG
jgi:aconitate hydratase